MCNRLAEAMEPQSMSAGASLVVTEPGADQISGRYEETGCLSYPNVLTLW
jgi:hypothetical protein